MGSIIDRTMPAPPIVGAIVSGASQPTMRRGRLFAALSDSPAMLACVLLAVGALVLVWTFATRPPRPYDVLLVVNALGLCLAGALLCGLGAVRARRERRPPTPGRRR
jgi:hypothetical protein